MIALVDYGAGNVRSVQKALAAVGAEVQLARGPEPILEAEKVVLPGVGAFGDCMAGLRQAGVVEALRRTVAEGRPLLGICVGMQVLFEYGEEMGRYDGLGFLPGRAMRFALKGLKIPHTGWNQIEQVRPTALLDGLRPGAWAYFNHAYYCQVQDEQVLAATGYGGRFASVVGQGSIYGIQFHPEKSQKVGLQILRNFVERVR